MRRGLTRRLAISAAAAALMLCVAGAGAQTLPPSPADDKNFPKSLAPVVAAEYAFANHSIAHGMKEAFIRFAAPDGLLFRRTPVNAIELWTKTSPAPTGLLTWFPTYADVSAGGDLGWTTGPWEFREKPTDRDAAGHGHFVTLWRRQPDGSFKFELDIGISHPAPARPDNALRYPDSLRKSHGARAVVGGAEAARASLMRAEEELAKDARSKGATRALLARADAAFMLYRQNARPVVGLASVRKSLGGKDEALTWRPTKTGASLSGDLGYSYGAYESGTKAAGEKPPERGHYVRIWKRQGGKWRVVLDITNPVAPPAP